MPTFASVKDARAEYTSLVSKGIAIRDKALADGKRDMTTDEKIAFDGLLDAADDLATDIKRMERAEKGREFLSAPVNRLPTGDGTGTSLETKDGPATFEERIERELKSFEYGCGAAGDGLFNRVMREGSAIDQLGLKHFCFGTERDSKPHPFALSTKELGYLQQYEQKALGSLRDNDGGQMTTPELSNSIIERLRDPTMIRGLARVETTRSHEFRMPTFDHSDTFTRTGENATISSTDVTDVVGWRIWRPHKFTKMLHAPQEWLDDGGQQLMDRIVGMYTTYRAEQEEAYFLTGNGNGQPLGILTEIAGTTREVDIAGSTTAIVYDDVIDLEYMLKKQYRKGARYTAHRNVIKLLRKLRAGGSTTTDGAYLWQPSMQAGQPATLNGYALDESEYFPDATAGADGDPMLLFGQWKNYIVVERSPISIVRSTEYKFEQDAVTWRFIYRSTGGSDGIAGAWARLNRK